MQAFISRTGGYLADSNATSNCQYCPSRTTDEFLEKNFNMFYSHHWRDAWFMFAYIAFNVSFVLLFDAADELMVLSI